MMHKLRSPVVSEADAHLEAGDADSHDSHPFESILSTQDSWSEEDCLRLKAHQQLDEAILQLSNSMHWIYAWFFFFKVIHGVSAALKSLCPQILQGEES